MTERLAIWRVALCLVLGAAWIVAAFLVPEQWEAVCCVALGCFYLFERGRKGA